ncbi:uncharacterized protein LOC124156305 isoform X1 [Ischnura elegans]|uniref:uncharacterized protein LOC124156305 isoform X1 n=1 Tax=Ischnura elegans TaxID=197161 RepID=UPI001ED88A3D|nr:uncharacterized protein LOC124156305 isoform X1 [Ischnura elegans]
MEEACPPAAATEDVRPRWTRLRCPVTMANLSVLCALLCLMCPVVAHTAFSVYRLVFGTLYPAYASYKAVRSRDVREYVKWMMYWIVFALFTCGETITDVFLSFWFPFYYEIKIGFVLWLLSPATKGSSILYRKFVHPMLTNREQEIDEYIARAKEQGYHTVLHLGSKGVNYATNVIMQTAIKGGGGLVNQLRKSYSLSDLTEGEGEPVGDVNRNGKDVDGLEYRGNRRSDRVDGSRPSNRARGYSPRRSASGSARMEMYFPEVDLEVRQRRGSSRSREPSVPLSHIRSSEDVSYGNHYYEDASEMETDQNAEEPGSLPVAEGPLVRTASVGSTRTTRTKGAVPRTSATSTTSTAAKKAAQGEDVEVSSSEEEDFWCDPADDFLPLPDRTIFVNDPSTFPAQNPHVAIESIVCSTDIVHLDILGSGVSDISGSIGYIEKKLTELDDVTEPQPVKVPNSPSDVSYSLDPSKLDNSGMDSTAVAEISPVTPKEKPFSDHEASGNLPSGSIDDKRNLNTSVENIEDCKTSLDIPSPVPDVSQEQPPVKESSTQQIPSSLLPKECEKIDAEENKEVSQTSSHVTDSGSKNEHFNAGPGTISEETRPDKSTVNLSSDLVDQPKSFEEANEQKVIPETKAGNSALNENDTNSLSNAMKETEQVLDPRGGRYHKPPAPKPPQQSISSDASLESEKCEDTGEGKSVRARLVLKPGIVRSLPDVNAASSSDAPVKSEVFMAVNSAPWFSRLSSSPSPQASPKPSRKGKLLGRSLSRGKADKGPEGSGLPRFLNMTGRPHLGSLTSIFPFWHGGSSSSGSKSDGKEEKKTSADAKGNKSSQKEEGKLGENESYSVITDGSRGVKTERQFPVHHLSHSPTRYGANNKI